MAYLTSIANVVAVLLFLTTVQAIRDHRRRGGLPYPPGPRPLPIIGNLLDIPKQFSWLTYTKFAKTHGSPLFLWQKFSSDKIDRGYRILPHFRAGRRCIELRQGRQGPFRKARGNIFRSFSDDDVRHVRARICYAGLSTHVNFKKDGLGLGSDIREKR